MKPEESIDFQIQMAWQVIRKFYNDVAGGYGFSWAAGKVLLAIDPDKGSPSTTLGPKMGIESTSLSRLLNKMENHGYIERKSVKEDKRKVQVILTNKGKMHRKKAKSTVIRLNETLEQKLGKNEYQQTLKNLSALVEFIQSGDIDAEKTS